MAPRKHPMEGRWSVWKVIDKDSRRSWRFNGYRLAWDAHTGLQRKVSHASPFLSLDLPIFGGKDW